MPLDDGSAGGYVGFALRAIGEGQSANQFARSLQEAGAGVRRQVALRIYGQARTLAAEYGEEITRPLDRPPTPDEAPPWETRESTGILQTVHLFYRERVTGNVVERFYNVKTAEGLTRQEVIDQAIAANVGNAVRYEQSLIGAFHTGAATLVARTAA